MGRTVGRTLARHGEKITPVVAALGALATLTCCLPPVGFAAAAATAGVGAVVSAYQGWFLGASVLLLVGGGFQLARVCRSCRKRGRAPSIAIFVVSSLVVLLVILFPQVLAAMIADWLS